MTAADFKAMRESMVASQLRTNAVTDPRVIAAMAAVPREDFVPDAFRATAYTDVMIALPGGGAINAPMVTGRLLTEARIAAGDTVLIIGDSSGYVSAVLKSLAATVTSDSEEGPFDAIVIDGAVERVPQSLIDALKPAGRLVAGLLDRGVTRLAVGRRGGTGFALLPFADADMREISEFSAPRVFAF